MAVMNILVIDDDPLNRKLVRTVLETRGHEVRLASTTREGLEEAGRSVPDIIVMDVQLPDMQGLAGIRELKSDLRISGVPVIAMTALAMKGDRERILASGFDHYIAKPIRYREFLDLVDAVGKGIMPQPSA